MPHAYTNGIVTFYEDTGEGPAVVLVHGHSVDLRMWGQQVPDILKAGYRAIRYDVRGHGRSMVPPSGYTWDNYALDLAELLDRVNIGRSVSDQQGVQSAHLVGCSMGGGIALNFALKFPERTMSLTLVDSALPGFTYSPEFSEQVQALIEGVRNDGNVAFERLWLTHDFFEGVRRQPERFEELREMVRGFAAPEYQEGYEGEDALPDTIEHLAEITAPALVVVGEHDVPDFQLISEILATSLANARRAVVPDAWHLPSMERPAEFNRLLIDFLRQTAGRA